jgi:prevent-host-death family protein
MTNFDLQRRTDHMHKVNIHEAKTHLSRLIKEVQEGEEVIIAKGNKPIVKLVLVPDARPKRKLGNAKGLITISPDFDEPLNDFKDYM